jgi:hypothetical protein
MADPHDQPVTPYTMRGDASYSRKNNGLAQGKRFGWQTNNQRRILDSVNGGNNSPPIASSLLRSS